MRCLRPRATLISNNCVDLVKYYSSDQIAYPPCSAVVIMIMIIIIIIIIIIFIKLSSQLLIR